MPTGSACFCGCGLEVPFGRRRAANAVRARFDEQLRVFRGALERGADTGPLAELVASGETLRDRLRGVVHGTIDRRDCDKPASRAWMKRGLEASRRLADEVAGQDTWGGTRSFEVERKLLVSRIAIPRAGERVEVVCDPDVHDRFSFRIAELAADVAGAPSRLDELAKLAGLRSSGVLTEEEFEAEKRRILAGD